MQDKQVRLYSAQWCSYCRALQKQLDSREVDYEYIDVDVDENRQQMNELTAGNQTIPVLFVGDTYKINPSAKELDELLQTA